METEGVLLPGQKYFQQISRLRKTREGQRFGPFLKKAL
ncbi:hypothetical protein CLOLEP_02158 [[Clostridium] leptum DSM 753]|uniref:Uncharacterized protein n=1 Tax=[Clostridium] leptum DSM 753 TaxID=428125 RepID=A7VUB2_9FIRM|nr:hypothetical protein CLOLEP_02158 [[Clostridium] leptum DSM 753]